METIDVQVNTTIYAPLHKVFNSIIDPDHLTKYFASKSSGPLVEGTKINWNFEDAGVQCDVHVLKVEKNISIQFEWNATGKNTSKVHFQFEALDSTKTSLKITESTFQFTPEDVKKVMGQTQGWTDFVCSLKTYLYTGVNLRNGQKN